MIPLGLRWTFQRWPSCSSFTSGEAKQCGTLTPTKEGKAKIKRCTKTGIEFFRQHLAERPPLRKGQLFGVPPSRKR